MVEGKILLETGTNEIELMEFTIHGSLYGINVAKVREIMLAAPVKYIPHVHPSVEGIFKPRDKVITVIDLPHYITGDSGEHTGKDLFICTNFNQLHIAFRVHTVVGISRISWMDIQKPDSTIAGNDDGITTGIAHRGDDLVTILDFEKVVADIAPTTTIQPDDVEKLGNRSASNEPIFIAEDSVLLARMLEDSLLRAGYKNLHIYPNGQEMWDALSAMKQRGPIADVVSLLITDIEMPQMDGHRLIKLMKSDPELDRIPIIIFSSLITEEMRIKGKELGADEQLAKPEINMLVQIIDRLLSDRKQAGISLSKGG